MGPTSRAPLPVRASASKALREMPSSMRPFNSPSRRNGGERLKDEAPFRDLWMRDRQAPRPEFSAAPQSEIEIENARAPAAPAPTAEIAFYRLETTQHFGRFKIAFDKRNCIGEIAPCAAVRGV